MKPATIVTAKSADALELAVSGGSDGTLGLSKDAKRCVALKPQNSNAAFQKDNLLLVAASPIDGEPITDMAYLEEHWPRLREDIASYLEDAREPARQEPEVYPCPANDASLLDSRVIERSVP